MRNEYYSEYAYTYSTIRLLGYADDVVAAETGDDEGVHRVEGRVNEIADGSDKDADMKVNIEKNGNAACQASREALTHVK